MDPSGTAKGCNPADMQGGGAADGSGVPRLGSVAYYSRLGSPLRTPPGGGAPPGGTPPGGGAPTYGAPPSPSRLPPPSASFAKGCNPADTSCSAFTKTLPPSAYRAAVAGGGIQPTPRSPFGADAAERAARHPCSSAAIRAAAVDLHHVARPYEGARPGALTLTLTLTLALTLPLTRTLTLTLTPTPTLTPTSGQPGHHDRPRAAVAAPAGGATARLLLHVLLLRATLLTTVIFT